MLLSKPQMQRLVGESKANRVLAGTLLPLNNNPSFLEFGDVNTVTVVVGDDPKTAFPVAFGLFNHCTPNQIYCSIAVTTPKYENNYVVVEKVKYSNASVLGINPESPPDQHVILKITKVLDSLPDISGLPQYYSAFETPPAKPLLQCVIDELIDITVGNTNFFINRNLTVDLYDIESGFHEHPDFLWRDFCGFVVSDRYQNLTSILKNTMENDVSKIYTYCLISKSNFEDVIEYDQKIGVMNRETYLKYLWKMSGVNGVIAKDHENQTVGYIFAINDHIIQCYAENTNVANGLFLKQLETMKTYEHVSLFIREDYMWIAEQILEKATQKRRVRRFHTRIVPTSVKWSKVFALGVGANLF